MTAAPNAALRMLTPGEAAALLGVSPKTLYRWRKAGDGPPFVQLGPHTWRCSEAALTRWIQQRRRPLVAAQ